MKKALLAGLFLSLVLSCSKDDSRQNNQVNNNPEDFTELEVSSTFDWRTTSKYSIQVTGVPTDMTQKRILQVWDSQQNVLAQRVVRLTENTTVEFTAAAGMDELTVKCGSIEKKVDVSNGKGSFNYLPEDDLSDLDPADR
ncbi:MAG: hypothetical protein ACPF9D_01320 [Owenweeksia sp.]